MKFSFANHDGVIVHGDKETDLARINPKKICACAPIGMYEADWPKADIVFSHMGIDDNWISIIEKTDTDKIFLLISNANFNSLFAEGEEFTIESPDNIKKEIKIFKICIFNQRLINGNDPDPQAVNALVNLTFDDAQYILSCVDHDGKTPSRVVFSDDNAKAGKHSKHSFEDYESLNLLFNEPANSDTLVGWYMLAQAHALCKIVKQKNGLRRDKSAWRINDSWKDADGDQAAKLIANDFDYMVGSWGLKLAEKEKNDINLKLQEFARIVYGDGQSEIAEKDVDDVLEALKKIFAPAGGRKK